MKRFITMLALIVVAQAGAFALAPVPAAAQTFKEANKCFNSYNGQGTGLGTNGELTDRRIEKFNDSGCDRGDGGNCSINDAAQGAIVSCTKPQGNGRTSTDETAVGITANCNAGSSNVCLAGLPVAGRGNNLVQNILQFTIGVIAAIALLFIVIGGVRYVLSQGDPQAVGKAKSTIINALIGLVVAIIAQVLVAFVINLVAP